MRRALGYLSALALLFALGGCSSTGASGRKNTSRTFKTVVVDAGHGGRDSGAVRRFGPPEKAVALDVAPGWLAYGEGEGPEVAEG